MSESLVNVAALCGIPVAILVLLFFHELGHAVPVLLAGGQTHITIGSHDGWTVALGRLTVTFGTDGVRNTLTYGDIQWRGVDSTFVHAGGILGGPFVTVCAILALGVVLLRGVDGALFWAVAYVLAFEVHRAYQTIVPKTYSHGPYRGSPSDGKRFQQLLQSRDES